MLTKSYLPSNLCHSSDSSDSIEICDSSDSSDSSEQKNGVLKKNSLSKTFFPLKKNSNFSFDLQKVKNSKCDETQNLKLW